MNARQAADQRLVQIHERMADAAPEFDNFNAITNFCNGFFDLKIPQFRYMAFGSKLFMFAAPCRLVVLDDKIYGRLKGFAARDNGVGRLAEILAVPIAVREHAITLLNAFVHLPQKMRGVTQSLIQAYAYWCLFCQAVAAHWQQHDKRWKASDVERWYFSRDPEE
ncbi:MAG: hypothetical protein HY360_11150 [Verrucomicrobia bacterium]|nr:hypothetical protein [Verrucomicrobiota bacterium]